MKVFICVVNPKFYILILFLLIFLLQSASEKHKINVPETMNEFLDMSDDEGESKKKNPYVCVCVDVIVM